MWDSQENLSEFDKFLIKDNLKNFRQNLDLEQNKGMSL